MLARRCHNCILQQRIAGANRGSRIFPRHVIGKLVHVPFQLLEPADLDVFGRHPLWPFLRRLDLVTFQIDLPAPVVRIRHLVDRPR